jgi:succinate dehydrogenase / fumarate reductase cytochrome b subunit
MALSIAHRVSGSALALGLVLLTWWLTSLAAGEESFATVQAVMDNWFGGLVLFAYTFILFFHLGNGIRHIYWDFGYGFEIEKARQSGMIVLIGAAAATLVTWVAILSGS